MFKLNSIYCLLLLLLPFGSDVMAQAGLPLRIELEAAKDSEDYNFKTVERHGLFVFYESGNLTKDSSAWVFIHYDTNLQRLSNFSIPLSTNTRYVNSHYTQDKLFVLFQKNYKKKTVPETSLLTINLLTNTFSLQKITGYTDINVFDIKAVDDHLFLFASTNEDENVAFYNLSTEQLSTPLNSDLSVYAVEFCKIDTFNRRVLFGIVLSGIGKSFPLTLCETDYDGKILEQTDFPPFSEYSYNSARATIIDSATVLIAGTYNHSNEKNANSSHTGVYTTLYSGSRFSRPQFINYTNLKYRDGKDSLRTANSKSQNLNLQLLIGDLSHNNDQFVFVTEVFYPEYNYSGNFTSYDYYSGYYNNPIMTKTFSGYRFVNAYITTFDSAGNLLWNHYLPFSNILTYHLAPRVSICFEDQDVLIYYPHHFSIVSTLVHGYDVLEKLTSTPLETLNSKDAVEYNRSVAIENWYGNNFLASGYQHLKNSAKTGKSKRYVFFLNKLIYR